MSRSLGINRHYYHDRGNHTCVPLQGMQKDDLLQRVFTQQFLYCVHIPQP